MCDGFSWSYSVEQSLPVFLQFYRDLHILPNFHSCSERVHVPAYELNVHNVNHQRWLLEGKSQLLLSAVKDGDFL